MHTEITPAYRSALASFDWFYAMSNDLRAFNAGQSALADLRRMQSKCDPSGAVWNQYKPASAYAPRPTVTQGALHD